MAGTTHLDFTDDAVVLPILKWLGITGSIAGWRMIEITNAVSLRFFDAYLRGAPKPSFDDDFPELTVEAADCAEPVIGSDRGLQSDAPRRSPNSKVCSFRSGPPAHPRPSYVCAYVGTYVCAYVCVCARGGICAGVIYTPSGSHRGYRCSPAEKSPQRSNRFAASRLLAEKDALADTCKGANRSVRSMGASVDDRRGKQ